MVMRLWQISSVLFVRAMKRRERRAPAAKLAGGWHFKRESSLGGFPAIWRLKQPVTVCDRLKFEVAICDLKISVGLQDHNLSF